MVLKENSKFWNFKAWHFLCSYNVDVKTFQKRKYFLSTLREINICKKGIKCKYYASYIICNTVFRTLLRSLQYSISPNILTFLYLLQQKKKYHKHFFLVEEMCLFLSRCFLATTVVVKLYRLTNELYSRK